MVSTVFQNDCLFDARSGLWVLVVGLLVVIVGCAQNADRLFARREAEQTGIDFANTIPEGDSLMNPLDFFYVYNGGVAAGDLNGDGRTDLYFAGNTVRNRFYLNQGDFQFRDVTEAAGVAAPGVWSTGVTLVDINQDGRMDVYVSLGGPASERDGAYSATAVRFESTVLDLQDDSTFALRALPRPVQMVPVFGMQTGDYDGDRHLDLLTVGNWYAPDPETGRVDASVGQFLRGTGDGYFEPTPFSKSGFLADKDAKGLSTVATGADSAMIAVVQNNDSLKAFAPTGRLGHYVSVRPLDRYAVLTYEDGSSRKEEFHYGSTYLSRSSWRL